MEARYPSGQRRRPLCSPADTCAVGSPRPTRPPSASSTPSAPYSHYSPYAPRRVAATPAPPASPASPASPSFRNCVGAPSTSTRIVCPNQQQQQQQQHLAGAAFSGVNVGPGERCIIIEEEIERVEPIEFSQNMQNTKKEVKLVRPYGVVIQSIEERARTSVQMFEAVPRGAETPPVVQRVRRKITRSGAGAEAGPLAGRGGAAALLDRDASDHHDLS